MTHVRAHTHMSVCASITKAILFEILDNCSLPQVTHLNSKCDIGEGKTIWLGQFSCPLTIKPRYCILCSQRALMRVPWNDRFTSQEIVRRPRIKLLIFNTKPSILDFLMHWIPKRVDEYFGRLCKLKLPTRKDKQGFPLNCPRHVFYVYNSADHSQG